MMNNINNSVQSNNNGHENNSAKDSSEEDFKKYNNGRWHLSEHFRFIRGYILYGNNWKKVINS
jgi:hypothetical protein